MLFWVPNRKASSDPVATVLLAKAGKTQKCLGFRVRVGFRVPLRVPMRITIRGVEGYYKEFRVWGLGL